MKRKCLFFVKEEELWDRKCIRLVYDWVSSRVGIPDGMPRRIILNSSSKISGSATI
jgi:hypothetical protein